MFDALYQFLRTRHDDIELVAALQQLICFLAAVLAPLVIWLLRRNGRSVARIKQLQRDLESRQSALEQSEVARSRLEQQNAELTQSLPESALARAETEWREGNDAKAALALERWLDEQGSSVADLLVARAKWATGLAVGECRAAGLAVAEIYTNTALVLHPEYKAGRSMLANLVALHEAEGRARLDFALALRKLAKAPESGGVKTLEVQDAVACVREARTHASADRPHLALPLLRRAVQRLKWNLGPVARQTLEARYEYARMLLEVGSAAAALDEFEEMIPEAVRHFPGEELTWAIRMHGADALRTVGRYVEALERQRELISQLTQSPKHGPWHPIALVIRHREALTLQHMARCREALKVVRDVIEVATAQEALGHRHLGSGLHFCRHLEVTLLGDMGRAREGLPLIRKVIRNYTASSNSSSKHPAILSSRYHEAQLLYDLDEYLEALQIIRDVLSVRLRACGVRRVDIETLEMQRLEARLLWQTGNGAEGLSIISSVATAMEQLLGPEHHRTLAARYDKTRLLLSVGRYGEALEAIDVPVVCFTSTPDIGPHHRDSLTCRAIRADVLYRLGRYEEGLGLVRESVRGLRSHPSFGPTHPDTRNCRFIEALILEKVGRAAEALEIVCDINSPPTTDAETGTRRRESLRYRALAAWLQSVLGNNDVALESIRSVISEQMKAAWMGSRHPETLRNRRAEAEILEAGSRYEEALCIVSETFEFQSHHVGVGPEHPETLRSGYVYARLLFRRGDRDRALRVLSEVIEKQSAHPSLGVGHPDTQDSVRLMGQ